MLLPRRGFGRGGRWRAGAEVRRAETLCAAGAAVSPPCQPARGQPAPAPAASSPRPQGSPPLRVQGFDYGLVGRVTPKLSLTGSSLTLTKVSLNQVPVDLFNCGVFF